MGAEEVGRLDVAQQRAAEAAHWAVRSAERLTEFAENSDGFSSDLQQETIERGRWRMTRGHPTERRDITFDELFHDSTLAMLYRAGVPIQRLRVKVRPLQMGSAPAIGFAKDLERAAQHSREYADLLQTVGELRAPWL